MNYLLGANSLQYELLRIIGFIGMFVGAVIGFWAMYLGFKMASASDEGKRKEAKKRLINSIVSMVLIIILAGMLFGINFMTGPGAADEGNITFHSTEFPDDGEWRTLSILSGGGLSQGVYDLRITGDAIAELRQGGVSGWEIRGITQGTTTIRVERRFTNVTANVEIQIVSQEEWSPPTPPVGDGEFRMPLNGSIGWLSSPANNRFGWRSGSMHAGVDLRPVGVFTNTDVVAAADGVVVISGVSPSAGEWIIIRHSFPGGNLYTRYLHLHTGSRRVGLGAQVNAGDVIGRTGITGQTSSRTPYVHFEISDGSGNNATRFNPFHPTQWAIRPGGTWSLTENNSARFTLSTAGHSVPDAHRTA